MSKSVVNSVSVSHNWRGSVEDVSTSTTNVIDQSDLDALEAKLNRKINSLQQSFDKLEIYLKKIASITESMPNEVKAEVQKIAERQKVVLNNEYKKIVDDMAKKCADISSILKK